MKIELFIAVILGTVLGLGGVYSIVFLTTRAAPTESSVQSLTAVSETPVPTQIPNTLITPSKSVSWDTTPLVFKGTTGNAFVFLSTDIADSAIPTTDNSFETTITPLLGLARYTVFTPSEQVLGASDVVSFQDLTKEQPLTFGTVTDLTSDGLQMRGSEGTIEQVMYSPKITFGSFLKEPKKVSPSDVAIGDRVVVVSDRSEKAILNGYGVFAIPPEYRPKEIQLFAGDITKLGKNNVSISHSGGEKLFPVTTSVKFFGLKADGTTRKRTKLIASDIGRKAYITAIASDSATLTRSIFISE